KVNKDNIVILDSLNYIKGYRYELFCLTKHAQTPHCLVRTAHRGTKTEKLQSNTART
ncbi:kti12, chromatin associated, partial [Goodea atripinnis]